MVLVCVSLETSSNERLFMCLLVVHGITESEMTEGLNNKKAHEKTLITASF